MKTIYISVAQKFQPGSFSTCNIKQWFYFSPDYQKFYSLKESCPKKIKYLEIGDLIQKKALELKDSYIDLIGKLGFNYSKRSPLSWWTSAVAERNEMSNNTFLTICYYNIVCELFEKDDFPDKSLFLVEGVALFSLLQKLSKNKYNVVVIGKPGFLKWTGIYFLLAAGYRLFKFFLWILCGKFPLIPQLKIDSTSKKVFVRTWISDKTISETGKLRDPYLPGLYEYLGGKGYEIIMISNLYNLTITKKELQKRMNRCEYQFFVPENYLNWKDYFKIFAILAYQAFIIRFKGVEHNGKDISMILMETHRAKFFGSSYKSVAQAMALKNLSREGFIVKSFIFPFENMAPEKPISYAVKKYFPGAKSVGFQHSVLYPLQMCHYPAALEWKIMPLPDNIVCSGKLFLDTYVKHGAPRERLVLGPALRFKKLMSIGEAEDENFSSTSPPVNTIIIPFPLAFQDAIELGIKSSEAIRLLKDAKELKIGLKPHPMTPLDNWKIVLSFFEGGDYDLEIIEGPLDEVIGQYSLLITMASGVVFDAMIKGIPVVRVGRSNSLNFDPADLIKNNPYNFKAQTVEQLNACLRKLLLLGHEERVKMLSYGRRFVRESFSPVNDNTLQAFLPDNMEFQN